MRITIPVELSAGANPNFRIYAQVSAVSASVFLFSFFRFSFRLLPVRMACSCRAVADHRRWDGSCGLFVRQLWGTPEAVEPDGSISKQKVPVAWLGGIVTADVPPPFPRHAHSLAATRSRQSAVDPAGTCADTNVLCTWPGDCCTRPPPLP